MGNIEQDIELWHVVAKDFGWRHIYVSSSEYHYAYCASPGKEEITKDNPGLIYVVSGGFYTLLPLSNPRLTITLTLEELFNLLN